MAKAKAQINVYSVQHVAREDLDGLAVRAAAGDREAEAKVVSNVTPIIVNIVEKIVARFHLGERKEELLQDGLLECCRVVRRYKPGKSHVPAFITFSLSRYLLRVSRAWWSAAGCHVAGGCRSIDFSTPAFAGTAPIATGHDDEEAALEPEAAPIASNPEDAERRARHRLFLRLRKLTPFEKEVLLRHCGIRMKPATRNPWCREAARGLRAETIDEIAASHEISREAVRKHQKSAMDKLGMVDLPRPAPRRVVVSVTGIDRKPNTVSIPEPF